MVCDAQFKLPILFLTLPIQEAPTDRDELVPVRQVPCQLYYVTRKTTDRRVMRPPHDELFACGRERQRRETFLLCTRNVLGLDLIISKPPAQLCPTW